MFSNRKCYTFILWAVVDNGRFTKTKSVFSWSFQYVPLRHLTISCYQGMTEGVISCEWTWFKVLFTFNLSTYLTCRFRNNKNKQPVPTHSKLIHFIKARVYCLSCLNRACDEMDRLFAVILIVAFFNLEGQSWGICFFKLGVGLLEMCCLH